MNIVTQVNPSIPNKYLRRLKYKLHKLKEKFKNVISTNLYIQVEGVRHKTYILKMVFSVPGPDIVVSAKGHSLGVLIEKCLKNSHRQLAELRV